MPKQGQYPLKDYIKAVEKLALTKNLRVEHFFGSKNSIRFEVFRGEETIPIDFWVIHTNHSKRREIWSKEDYRKPEKHLNARQGEFMEMLGR